MFVSFLIGGLIFGYAGFSLYKHIKKSKQGQCAACPINENCAGGCHTSTVVKKD
ncbi:FeoB-associated Cys-rich membrane protein [Bacillus carboniphilus]|uniref:FeoB-associated Cys-rich membrane protein n=1 Tax=Bacillus carboniphilus TaxID=86663 RepID=A0ABY9JUD7_9BACI|nr:FeoB-associated Cys-rich membrane protein [Bacillus carboniphilus]WLR43016.1 FeoB-associated Cys-rich membrane protein [Bacillus carboniphilus]